MIDLDSVYEESFSDTSYSSGEDIPGVKKEDSNVGHQDSAINSDLTVVTPTVARRVTIRKSPMLECFYKHHPIKVCLDTGSESNLISYRCAKALDLVISKSSQGAVQADGKAPLTVIGEVKHFVIVRGSHTLTCEALVVEEDIGDVVGGEPFLEINDIYVRSARKEIIIKDSEVVSYSKLS